MIPDVCRPSAALADELESPVRVRFSLLDGAVVTGELTAWDQHGIDGSFGRRAWSDLAADDLWRLYRAVMDSDDVDQWINLGRLLLLHDDGHDNAERAFRRALQLSDAAQQKIDAARAEAAQVLQQRREQQERSEQQQLDTDHPETREYSSDPWPALTDDQQALNTDVMRGRAAAIVDRAGVDMSLIETTRFLLYSSMEHAEALRWGRTLDRCYESLAGATGADPAGNIFWGKAVVLVFEDYDRFRVTEANMFNHLSPRTVHGLMHPDGPRVFISIHCDDDEATFGELLCQLTTYAFLHRLHAPMRLPAWAADGLALHAARTALDRSNVEQVHRSFGLQFVREHPRDVPRLLTLSHGDQHWPGPNNVGPAVGYLLIELLLREDHQAFAKWIRTVKTGGDWPKALGETYGAPATTIVDRFVRWYRVNN